MSGGQHGATRRHARPSRWPGALGAALAAVALLAVGVVVGFVVARAGTSDAAAPGDPPGPQTAASQTVDAPGPPTVLADVTRVVSGDRVMVAIGGAEETVRILGLDAPDLATSPGASVAQCGSREALEFADERLTGQTVTLVPDPTLTERDGSGARLAYVVLRTQQNFTDAALLDGVARADTTLPLWYADVFAGGQQAAVDAGRGIWGAPCNEEPAAG